MQKNNKKKHVFQSHFILNKKHTKVKIIRINKRLLLNQEQNKFMFIYKTLVASFNETNKA